jgi:hypothetical protein
MQEEIRPIAEAEGQDTPVIGYAPASLKARLSFPQRIAIGVMAVGTVAYGIACYPAYGRSGWPPLDRLSEAMPWLWIFLIPIFTLIVPGNWFSRIALLSYALVTSAIDAWTFGFGTMNPHRRFDVDLWIENLIVAVPVHLVVTAGVALLSRGAYWVIGLSAGLEERSRKYRWGRIGLIASIVVLAAIFPLGYRSYMSAQDADEGAQIADRDWANQKASIISGDKASFRELGGYEFFLFFDLDSGFPLKQSWLGRWEPGYNAEIRRLVKSQGIPNWSLKSRFVSDADMVRMLTAQDMKKVTSYPYILSPNVVLLRGGGVTPWGQSVGSNSNYLDIQSRNQQMLPLPILGEEKDPAFVGQLAKYPGTFLVRCGKSVVVCTADGWELQAVLDDR